MIKGEKAARQRKRKFDVLRAAKIPPDALPGSLSLSYRKCGKPTCRCAKGEGHAQWLLTFMDNGKKRVEWVPADWAEDVRRQVDAGRRFKDGFTEVLLANAELFVIRRGQRKK